MSELRRNSEPQAEKAVRISVEDARYPCKCRKLDKRDPVTRKAPHKKEVFSDGWTRWECRKCGQVKFSRGGEEEI